MSPEIKTAGLATALAAGAGVGYTAAGVLPIKSTLGRVVLGVIAGGALVWLTAKVAGISIAR